jgi:hypothetical protein
MKGFIRSSKLKKKGQDRNPAPFLNPISYEKPNSIRQVTCRKGCNGAGDEKDFSIGLITIGLYFSKGRGTRGWGSGICWFSPMDGKIFPSVELGGVKCGNWRESDVEL